MGLQVKAIIFDFYFTLVDPRVHSLDSIAELVRRLDSSHAADEVWAAWVALRDTRPDGSREPFATFSEYWCRYGAELFAELGMACDGDEWGHCRRDAHSRAVAYDDVAESLAALRAGGYALAVLSDADNDYLHAAIAANAFEFDAVISSEDLRCYKPNATMFRAIADRVGVSPREAAYVGDNPTSDVVGSRNAGMTSVWINRLGRDWPTDLDPPAHTITSLRDLDSLR